MNNQTRVVISRRGGADELVLRDTRTGCAWKLRLRAGMSVAIRLREESVAGPASEPLQFSGLRVKWNSESEEPLPLW